jgi:hypothetical protein
MKGAYKGPDSDANISDMLQKTYTKWIETSER